LNNLKKGQLQMTQIGKSSKAGMPLAATMMALVICAASAAVSAQNAPAAPAGNEINGWKSPDTPGDGKAEVVLADGTDPAACRVAVSVKGSSCTKVLCKGEQAVFTNSSQSILAAKRIALSVAKAHYVHFLQEEINSKRATDTIDSAIKKEAGGNAGTSATSGYVVSQSIREQASALIKGFAVIEDGVVTDEAGGKVAYAVGGVSCVTQNAADSLNARNASNSASGQGQSGTGPASGAQPANSRRRALDSM
jgi:hypothetical protein